MNELRKYATFSIDLIGEPIKVNSMFSIGRARIFYLGPNPNRSIIEEEAANKLASSIPGTPIVGLYNYETDDFEGHGDGQSAYGFVPLEPNATWVKIKENDKEREYLEVDVVIWDGRFDEAKNILSEQKSLSMELNPATLKGTMVRLGEHMYYKITNAEFAGITVLGDDVEPCFKDAGFLMAYSHMVNEYANFMDNIQKQEEGGINHMENVNEQVNEVVESELTTESIDSEKEIVLSENIELNEDANEEDTIENDNTEETSNNEIEFACGDNKDKADSSKKECSKKECSKKECAKEDKESDDNEDEEDKEEEVCPECGENPCVCKNACGDGKKKYSELEYELAQEKAKNESLQNELNAAQEALNKYSRSEKLEIITKFSTKLEDGEELIAKLTDKVDELTKDEIKAELGSALVDQIEASEAEKEEDVNNNFSLNLDVKQDLSNTAWDLVKRFKSNK